MKITVLCLSLFCTMVCYAPGEDGSGGYSKEVSLAQAVTDFNHRASFDTLGKAQPPLTEDEVIAAIRYMTIGHAKDCQGLAILEKIAATRTLPIGGYLDYMKGYSDYDRSGFDVQAWRIDLNVIDSPANDGMGRCLASCTLRQQIISSKPHVPGSNKQEQEILMNAYKQLKKDSPDAFPK